MPQNCIMFHQMAGLSIQSPLTTISVLVFHLVLIPFSGGQSQLIGSSQPIVATIGDDIILPCHLKPAEDVAAKTLEWTRSDLDPRFVYVWRARQELLDLKNPSYSGRTSLFTDALKHGNISLKLSKVKTADQGRYKCFIPEKEEESFIELVVASDAAASPVVSLAGTDRDKGGVVLDCKSKGWHPEPDLLWLDGEGKLLSAGPTETVRGPDDLYTVSSRVTVEKRHSNNFTCRVQQKIINQSRETHFYIPDDFFRVHSSSSVIIALAVTLAVSIMIFLSLFIFIWKRQNIIKTQRRQRGETGGGKREREKLMTDDTAKMEDLKKSKGKPQKEEAEQEVETLKSGLETKFRTQTKELEEKQSGMQHALDQNQRMATSLQTQEDERETIKPRLERSRASPAQSSFLPWKIISRQKLQEEQKGREEAESKVQTLEEELKAKKEELERKQAETDEQLKQETQRRTTAMREVETLKNQLETQLQAEKKKKEEAETSNNQLKEKITQLERKQAETNRQMQQEKQRRTTAEREVETLKNQLERKQAETNRQLQQETQERVTDDREVERLKNHQVYGGGSMRGSGSANSARYSGSGSYR